MAFTISRSQSALSEKENESLKDLGDKESVISSQLQLKSSLSSSSQSMDKRAILRRIRQRRSYNRAKSALEALLGSPEANSSTSAHEQKWLQLCDSFSSP
ncbi:hypothetical protein VNO78_26759 [Psophocarpus tetragonolobus]|uniref:Uncharacterized protein n=1 Tax=Psophocarpus tetragonolobus TaxID=3891 RepID=A0AAN9X9B7_PSOTE